MTKPYHVFMAQVEATLLCECGQQMTRTLGGYYVCHNEYCKWRDKELKAVIMPAAAMYELKKGAAR